MYHLLFSFILIICFLTSSFAQSNFSESFLHVPKNAHIYLPSSACIDNDLQSSLVHKSYLGKLSIIRTYYADLNLSLGNKKKTYSENRRHVIGLGLYNDREGDFFNKVRVITRYALHLPLQENLFLSTGGAFHLINYDFHASTSGAAGSDMGWSGNISSTLYSSSFKLAVAINDFNNPTVRPISYEFNLNRYITFYGEKTYDLGINTEVKGSGRYNLVFDNPSSAVFQLGLIFSKMVGASAFYQTNRGTGFVFDLNGVKLYKNNIDFSLAYLIPNRKLNPAVSQYEINLHYYIQRNRDL